MSNISTAIQTLGLHLSATFTSATVYYERDLEIDDNSPLPLFEIKLVGNRQPSFSPVALASFTVLVQYLTRTDKTKLNYNAIDEKLSCDSALRQTIKEWHWDSLNSGIGMGAISNIETEYLETFSDGEFGGLDTKIIHIALQFSISIKN